jgi:peptidoglycan hydrolase-like protein with peptidoglycan-binding domain
MLEGIEADVDLSGEGEEFLGGVWDWLKKGGRTAPQPKPALPAPAKGEGGYRGWPIGVPRPPEVPTPTPPPVPPPSRALDLRKEIAELERRAGDARRRWDMLRQLGVPGAGPASEEYFALMERLRTLRRLQSMSPESELPGIPPTCVDAELRPHPLVWEGSSNPAVREAKRKLNVFQSGSPDEPLAPDCRFGPDTRQAVLVFQRAQFADPRDWDGRVGPKTWSKLDAVIPLNIHRLLRVRGVAVVEEPGWQGKGRTPFRPVGVMVHHTAGPRSGDRPSLSVVIGGRPGIPPPLCNILLARSGRAHLVAALRANHAGAGSGLVLDEVRRGLSPAGDASIRRLKDDTTGNSWFYGIEVENSGLAGDPYPSAQIGALVRICSALCGAHGWSAARIVHHREWTRRKPDMSFREPIRDFVDSCIRTRC